MVMPRMMKGERRSETEMVVPLLPNLRWREYVIVSLEYEIVFENVTSVLGLTSVLLVSGRWYVTRQPSHITSPKGVSTKIRI
jgi:hypothetical protein